MSEWTWECICTPAIQILWSVREERDALRSQAEFDSPEEVEYQQQVDLLDEQIDRMLSEVDE